MTPGRNPTVLVLVGAAVGLLALGLLMPDWLRFLVQISLANSLAVLGVMLQMRAGLVSFGQGLYYCIGGYAAFWHRPWSPWLSAC
jgi:branched-chain amino acid transport system permease protein